MQDPLGSGLMKIGVFYDGGFLQFVSDYYRYHHQRRARLSIRGLHSFIENHIAREENVDVRYCHVVDAHYFRGRFPVDEAVAKGKLEGERAFDDVLMRENVVTHYLPRSEAGEKGIDVWLALEAYELAVVKKFNVLALVAGDGDYLPLVRKLNALGTRVMLLAWDFTYQDDHGRMRETRTAQTLIEEVTLPVHMQTLIDSRSYRADPIIDNLFTEARYEQSRPYQRPSTPAPTSASAPASTSAGADNGERHVGTIRELRRDRFFGIIEENGQTWLMLSTELSGVSFDELEHGDRVQFGLQPNPEKPGQFMASQVTLIEEEGELSEEDEVEEVYED